MYEADALDRAHIRARAAQFRDQWARHQAGRLSDEAFRPLRLQNGWYLQRHAPMLRVAVPYGALAAHQARALADVARRYDRQDDGTPQARGGFVHLTTRQNVQFNWIALKDAADVMDRLAESDLHGIQTSGNCIRNITSDALAGVAPDEVIDPRPYAELLRQWSSLHPEFAFLPRKFKIAISGSTEDRAALRWHDIGLQLRHGADGRVGFQVYVGGGMGRTPLIAPELAAFVPWDHITLYLEAVVRVYNRFGRRDNAYKARIKVLVRAEGQGFIDAVAAEYAALLQEPQALLQRIPQAELDRVAAHFTPPKPPALQDEAAWAGLSAQLAPEERTAFARWLARAVQAHRVPGFRAVLLSVKRPGLPPGDLTADQLDAAANLAERFSASELRVTHEQNLVLPWVRVRDLPALWQAAQAVGLATPNLGLLSDLIACPGGDLCALANARTLPLAQAVLERFTDLDEQEDLGDIALHMSGCMNSCGHHHSGHIGVLGVDKDGREWYQLTLGGSDGRLASGAPQAGKVIGPAFAADELLPAIEAVLQVYVDQRTGGEAFVDAVRRIGVPAFRAATDAVRGTTRRELPEAAQAADPAQAHIRPAELAAEGPAAQAAPWQPTPRADRSDVADGGEARNAAQAKAAPAGRSPLPAAPTAPAAQTPLDASAPATERALASD